MFVADMSRRFDPAHGPLLDDGTRKPLLAGSSPSFVIQVDSRNRVRTYAGYRRLHTYLRREDHQRTFRLYSEEGLALRRKKPRRRRSVVARRTRPEPTAANQSWSMNFMHDALVNGKTLRIFTLIDVHTRECLALKPATGFSGAAVAQILADVGERRSLPQRTVVDHGRSSPRRHWTLGRTGTG